VEYYRIMGWDEETGLPRRATLEALDMKDEADRFETIGFNLPD
jgi:aldehyde:ferredoxin oxidoreductase